MTNEEREDLNTFRHDLIKRARWWQWKAETLEKENEQLKSENAALKERLEKAVKDVAERIENALFCEFADDMTFKMASRIEEVIKAELNGGGR